MKPGVKPGSKMRRTGGYALPFMAVGECKVFRPEDHGKSDAIHLSRNIKVSITKRRDMRFTYQTLPYGVWVKRLA